MNDLNSKTPAERENHIALCPCPACHLVRVGIFNVDLDAEIMVPTVDYDSAIDALDDALALMTYLAGEVSDSLTEMSAHIMSLDSVEGEQAEKDYKNITMTRNAAAMTFADITRACIAIKNANESLKSVREIAEGRTNNAFTNIPGVGTLIDMSKITDENVSDVFSELFNTMREQGVSD